MRRAGRLALIGQVVTALLLGIILIVFQTFSITQQPSWAQQQQSPSPPSSSSDFEQFAQRVREAVQGAGATGSVQEFPAEDSTQFYWNYDQLFKCAETDAACEYSETRIYIDNSEPDALEMFNSLFDDLDWLEAEEFDVGTSQNGYTRNFSGSASNPLYGNAEGESLFLCGTITGTVFKSSKTSTEQVPPNATIEQLDSIQGQKKAEADAKAAAHRAEVESLAKRIVQALITNGLCNMPSTTSQTCPSPAPLTQDGTTTETTATMLPSSSFAQKESDLLVDTSSSNNNNNNGDKPVQYTTATTSTGQIANMAAAVDYESSSFSSSTGAVYPVSPQQPPTTTSSPSYPPPPRKPILFDDSAPENGELFEEKTFDKPPWYFKYQIVEGRGLVFENIRAGGQLHFESVSVPHFEMTFSNGLKKIVRFECGDFRSAIQEKEERQTVAVTPELLSNPEDPKQYWHEIVRHRLFWQFEKVFENLGTLTIDYDIVIRTDPTRCEFIGYTLGISNCFRFIPRVNYYWQPDTKQVDTPQTLEGFTAYYRLDYGPVGIAIDKNEDNIGGATTEDTGRLELLQFERQFWGVLRGAARANTFDNIHNAHPGQTVFAPMCRFTIPVIGYLGTFPPFDCNHIHWRWGGTGVMNKDYAILNWGITPNVDPMIDPFNDNPIPENQGLRGTPYLVPGQTIRVAVVEEKGTEEDPDSPLSPQIVNNEKIADIEDCANREQLPGLPSHMDPPGLGGRSIPLPPGPPHPCKLVSAEEPVRIWYAATSHNKNSDTFFRHGTYVIDLKGEYKIKTALQNLRYDLELTKSNIITAAPALDESNINEILAYLNQALADGYWVTDGTLVPVEGEKVFAELSRTVELMQQIKENEQDPQTSQLMDAATSIVLFSIQYLVLNTMHAGNEKLTELTIDAGNEKLTELSSNLPAKDDKSALDNLVKQNEALNSSLMYYAAAVGETDLANSPQIIDNFRLSWDNTIVGLGEIFSALGIAPPAAITTSTPTTTTATTPTANATAAPGTTTTNGTTTTTTTPTTPTPPPTLPPPATSTTPPSSSITAVTLHPDSVPQFFKCGETPDNGSPTLPGLDVQSSASTAITDGDVNTEILGKAIFDVTLSEPITNGPGPDLAVYEIGNDPEPFNVTLFSGDIMTQSIQYTAVASATGDTDDCGFVVNIAEIDLSDFGLGGEEGEEGQGSSGNEEIIAITGIRVDNQGAEGCCTGADISDVFVLTTTTEQVPPPSTTSTTTSTTPPTTTPPTPGTNATNTITTATDGTINTTTTTSTTTTTPPNTPPNTTTPTSTCTNTPSGLVAWWPAAGNADDFLGNNDGVLQNGASFSGIVGNQAFRLDGVDDYVQIPSMNIGNTFSLDFWVYPELSTTSYQHLISNHFASGDHFGALYLRDGNLEYWHNNAARFQQVPGSQTIQPNTWTHIALTYDGSVIRIYANGSELSGVTTTGNEHSETFNNAIRIGSSDPHESSYLQGLIDDVGIYNRALSLSEIQALSEVGKCSPTAASAAATTTTSEEEVVVEGGEELVPLLPEQQIEQQLQQQQQDDDEGDAEGGGEEQQEEGQQGLAQGGGGEGQELALTQCDPSYPNVCIPPPPPDLDCGDEGISENFQVLPPNPHAFDDEDNDGIGCETEQ